MIQNLNELEWDNKDLRALLTRLVQFGEVVKVDAVKRRVKVKLPGQGGSGSAWLQVGVRRAKGVSQVHTYSVGEQVACLFQPMGDGAAGVVLCALHNDEDAPWTASGSIEGSRYDDGTTFSYDMDSKTLLLSLTDGTVSATATPDGWVFKGKVVFEDEVTHNKAVTCLSTVAATGSISSLADISDGKGSMSAMRVIYNGHTHTETNVETLPPSQPMKSAVRRSKRRKP